TCSNCAMTRITGRSSTASGATSRTRSNAQGCRQPPGAHRHHVRLLLELPPGRGAIRASSRHDVGRGGAFMRNACWPISRPARPFLRPLVAAALAAMVLSAPLPARATSLDDLIGAVVTLKTHINPEGRTIQGLGRDREGSGVLIDADGLILTIGYLMVEAYAAEIITNDGRRVRAAVVGYDHETGFGLLRAIEPLKVKPIALGKSADVHEKDVVVVASGGGASTVAPAVVVAKRVFAGNWEYMLDE